MDTRSVTASVILAVGIAGGFALLGSNHLKRHRKLR